MPRTVLLVTALAASLALVGHAAGPAKPPAAKEKFHLFLLVGQSNMAGRGKPTEDDRTPHPRVWALNKAGEWVPAVAPLHFDKPTAGVGPGVAFGKAVAEKNPDVHIGLIPCAVGGSALAEWEPGRPNRKAALARTKRAVQDGTLKAVLWHQGESDIGKADTYLDRLTTFVTGLREELGDRDLPFIAGELGPWLDDRYKAITAASNKLPEKLPRTACVSAAGLKNQDAVHFDAASENELGRRYAEAYFKLK